MSISCAKCGKALANAAEADTHKCVTFPPFDDARTAFGFCGPTVIVTHPLFPAYVLDIRNVPEEIWQQVFRRDGM